MDAATDSQASVAPPGGWRQTRTLGSRV